MPQKKTDHQPRQDKITYSQRDNPPPPPDGQIQPKGSVCINKLKPHLCDKRWQTNKSDGQMTQLAEANFSGLRQRY